MYKLKYSQEFTEDVKKLNKEDKSRIKKLNKLLEELKKHPKTGTCKPEMLKHIDGFTYSRRITKNIV